MKSISQKFIDSIIGITSQSIWYKLNEWKLAVEFYDLLKYKKYNDYSQLNFFINKRGSIVRLSFKKFGSYYFDINVTDIYLLDILHEFLFENAYPLEKIDFKPILINSKDFSNQNNNNSNKLV
jgi:hypothetical protein